MLPVGFKRVIPTSERSQKYTLDRAATGIDYFWFRVGLITKMCPPLSVRRHEISHIFCLLSCIVEWAPLRMVWQVFLFRSSLNMTSDMTTFRSIPMACCAVLQNRFPFYILKGYWSFEIHFRMLWLVYMSLSWLKEPAFYLFNICPFLSL
jgi:hypothetical protein